MPSRSTPRRVALLTGALSLIFVPNAMAGTVQVEGTALVIREDDPASPSGAPGTQRQEINNITVERVQDANGRQIIIVRDSTTATNVRPGVGIPDPLKGTPLDIGAGCSSFADPNSIRPAARCESPRFTEVRAELGDLDDYFAETQTDTQSLDLPPASIIGGAGPDVLVGTNAADTLNGGDGSDQLYGLEGDDKLLPGAGNNDPIAGDAGDDTVDYGATTAKNLTVILDNIANDGESGQDNVTAEVEDVVTGAGNDTIIMFDPAAGGIDPGLGNTITANGGNDTIKSGAGDDSVSAGEGDNVVDTGSGTDTGSSGSGKDNVTLGAGEDTFTVGDGNNTVSGGAAKDTITGGADVDVLRGDAGPDVLNAGAGNNSVFGGTEDDTIDAGAGNDSLEGEAGKDTITDTGGDNTANGGDDDDTITTGAGVDTIDGGFGDDTVTSGGGNDGVSGGEGNDKSLSTGAGDDLVRGNGGNDTLDAGDGNDRLQGGDGADALTGGAGTDQHSYAEKTADVYADLSNPVVDNVQQKSGSGGCPTATTCEGDTFPGATVEDLLGGAGNDLLIGTTGANKLEGAAGDDRLRGGLGADTLIGNAGYDQVSYRERKNGVTVTLDGAPGDGESGENDNVAGDIERVEGGEGGDRLTGSEFRNDLLGHEGNDTLEGQQGPDLLDGGSDTDTVSYGLRTDDVTVTTDGNGDDGSAADASSGSDGLPAGTRDNVLGNVENLVGGSGNDKLFTLGIINGVASTVDNNLSGGPGHDQLDGYLGADTFLGGTGDDAVRYSGRSADATVTVTLDGNRNDGTSNAAGTISEERDLLGDDIEQVIGGDEMNRFFGAAGIASTFIGGGGKDFLQGRTRADRLEGGTGDDELRGGADNDVLVGGDGCDVLNGEADNDQALDAGDCDTLLSVERGPGQEAPAPVTQQQASETQEEEEQAPAPIATPAPAPTSDAPAAPSSETTQGAEQQTAGSTSSGSAAPQRSATAPSTAPESGSAGTTTGSSTDSTTRTVVARTLKSVKVARKAGRSSAKVTGRLAGGCRKGQRVQVRIIQGKKVLARRNAVLGKGCSYSVLVPVKTTAKTVKAEVLILAAATKKK